MVEALLAYVDPGIGATLAQLAVAGTAGVVAAAKLRMNKFKRKAAEDSRNATSVPADDTAEVPRPAE